ncbi:MAG: PepSY-associated TM helix domain-containing protein, partial [Gammaproteobacteria bacterium]
MRQDFDDPAEAARGEELQAQPKPRLFRAVWRWHFYAGLLVIPFIVILSLSGIVYLFKPQLDGLFYGHMRNVEPAGKTVSYDKQLAAAKAAVPGGTVLDVGPPPESTRATEFGVMTKNGAVASDFGAPDRTVFVDPYTGEVTGQRDNHRALTNIALDLHGTLLARRFMDEEGKWGDRLLELVAAWAVVLVVTGMYLWWRRGRRRSLRAALKPRWWASARRARWRDVHAITGVLFSFVFLFFLVTGLAWTGVWGAKYQEIATKLDSTYPPG